MRRNYLIIKVSFLFLSFLTLLAVALTARANTVTWNLSEVLMVDGLTAEGWFSVKVLDITNFQIEV
jgi:hypothetical protein